jgi:hypothetical protein
MQKIWSRGLALVLPSGERRTPAKCSFCDQADWAKTEEARKTGQTLGPQDSTLQEDRPENYHTLLYELEERGGRTHVSVSQDNNASKEAAEHPRNWEKMLVGLKQVAERT